MSREGKGIISIVLKNFINSLKPRQIRGTLIGRDYLGNEYFEILPQGGNKKRSSRWYVTKDKQLYSFDKEIPVEWEAWLRHRRRMPPTEEEISKNLALMEETRKNSQEIDSKFGIQHQPHQQPVSIDFPKYTDYEQMPGQKNN